MVSYLAELGKLAFSPEELEQMAKDMTSIIAIMDTVKEIDITYDAVADNKISVYRASQQKKFCKMLSMMKIASSYRRS